MQPYINLAKYFFLMLAFQLFLSHIAIGQISHFNDALTATLSTNNHNDSSATFATSNKYANRSNQIHLLLSLPLVNQFCIQPQNIATINNIGILGASIGVEYYYKNNKSLIVKFIGVTDSKGVEEFPLEDSLTITKEYIYNVGASVTDNFKINRFSFGYGLNLSYNIWRTAVENPYSTSNITLSSTSKKHFTTGFHLDGYYHLAKSFTAGIMYRPSFFIISPKSAIKYEHAISLDIKWNIVLKK